MKKIRLPLTILMIVVAMFLGGCEGTDQQEVKSTLLNSIESPIVSQIKSLNTPEGILLGDLIEAGMGSCTYELYDPAEDGNTYVTISGNITYNGIPVVAKLQYKQINDSVYEFYTLVYNDLPRTELEINEFFQYLYDSYNDKQVLEATTNNVSTTEMAQSSTETQMGIIIDDSNNSVEVDGINFITSFVDIDSYAYEYGSKSQYYADFNRDGVEDTVQFYFEQTWFFITYFDGTKNEATENWVSISESILDENGEIPVDLIALVSLADIDQNGDFEVLISFTNSAGSSAMSIYDEIDGDMKFMGAFDGQFEFVIFKDGEIFAPIGSQGLGSTYRYEDGVLYKTN